MYLAQQATSMILSLRKRAEKNVRQPLQKAVIPTPDQETTDALQHVAELIKSEVNVKEPGRCTGRAERDTTGQEDQAAV